MVHFANFWGRFFFFNKIRIYHAQLHVFLAPFQNLEKTDDTIPRKRQDRRKDGKRDGQTLFYRTFAVTIGGFKNKFNPIRVCALQKQMKCRHFFANLFLISEF